MIKRSITPRKIKDKIIVIFSNFSVFLAVLMMLWVVYTVFRHGMKSITFSFLTSSSKPYGMGEGGIANALLGTFFITSGAALLAVPAGLLGGIYLSEYKDYPKISNTLRFSANVMMGMPSVLIGLFVYLLIVVQTGNFSGMAASVALAIIMLPVIMRTTEDMLSMVPYELRESALALGMSRARTTLHVVCLSAKNGLLTGILLSLSRVSGETAPLLFTAMFADGWPFNYFSGPTANMPVLITEYSTNSPFESMHRAGWGAALLVTILVLMINLATRILFREKKHGH